MPLAEAKIDGFVGTICLDYYEKRNALSAALVEDVLGALDAFIAAESARRRPPRPPRRQHLVGGPPRRRTARRAPRSARLVRPFGPLIRAVEPHLRAGPSR